MALTEGRRCGPCASTCSYWGIPNLRWRDDAKHSTLARVRRVHRAAPLLWVFLLLYVANTIVQDSVAMPLPPFLRRIFGRGSLTPSESSESSTSRNASRASAPSAGAGEQMEQCTKVLDLCFVVDESGSIGSQNFRNVRRFLSDFLKLLPISESEVHVALVAYGDKVRTVWDFSATETVSQSHAVKKVSGMSYAAGGATMTHSALNTARSLLTAGNGARTKVPKVIVLLTDGSSTRRSSTLQAAKTTRDAGIQIFVVGVGNADSVECQSMCGCQSDDCPQFLKSSWSGLASQVMGMLAEVCKKLPKDAVCSAWSDWSTCSVSCGEGTRTKSRQQVSPPLPGDPPCDGCPAHMGKSCEEQGGLELTEPCNPGECPVDAGCGEWGEWSQLSATCGTASQHRHRVGYNDPPPQGAGLYCEQQVPPKLPEESRSVELPPCVTETLEEWNEWSPCDVTCGSGKRRRTRSRVVQVGTQITEEQQHEEETCDTTPCPVDAHCGEFGEWSACSRTCGGGTSVRVRNPWLHDQQYGGRTCSQQHPEGREQRRDCNTEPCPVHEQLGEWEPWGQCSVTCGDGIMRRYRKPSAVKAAYGGLTIEEQIDAGILQAELEETKVCSSVPCGPCTYPFADWSSCQGTCGSGHRERHTTVKFDYPTTKCALPTYELEVCTPAGCAAGGTEEATGGEEAGQAPGEEEQPEKEEGGGGAGATIAGGVVGGALLLGAIGGGAYYGMSGKATTPAAQAEADFGEQGPRETVEEERETMIGVDEESDMWSS